MNSFEIACRGVLFYCLICGSVLAEPVRDSNAVLPHPPAPKLEYLQSLIDPVFGSKITKITGTPGKSRAVFCGHRDDIAELMTAMDIYALPSYREGYPRSAMEACAMSLPVVATNIRGCREVVVDGENGFLVEVRNADMLAEAIEKLINDEKLIADMGSAGRRRAKTAFDELKVIEIIKQEYEQLLKRYRESNHNGR